MTNSSDAKGASAQLDSRAVIDIVARTDCASSSFCPRMTHCVLGDLPSSIHASYSLHSRYGMYSQFNIHGQMQGHVTCRAMLCNPPTDGYLLHATTLAAS